MTGTEAKAAIGGETGIAAQPPPLRTRDGGKATMGERGRGRASVPRTSHRCEPAERRNVRTARTRLFSVSLAVRPSLVKTLVT